MCVLFLFALYIVGILDPQRVSSFRPQRSDSKGRVLESPSAWNSQGQSEDTSQHGIQKEDEPEKSRIIDDESKHNQTKSLLAKARSLIPSILDPDDTSIDRMSCPRINATRYAYLRPTPSMRIESTRDTHRKDIFTLNLRQCVSMLPRLMGSIIQVIRFLGPHNCGRARTRIKILALLRNMALELLHQRLLQRADMVCAVDWRYTNETDPSDTAAFYDVWVSRTPDGDLFFDIPPSTGGWEHSADLFPTEAVTRSRFEAGLPFQVFSCWNGAVAFSAEPLIKESLPHATTRFRWPMEGECFQGEPQLFCKDLWWRGYGRIAVVPGVNLGYTDTAGRRVKQEKGFVSDFISNQEDNGKTSLINWQSEAPEKVKCMLGFKDQTWLSGNESLADDKR